MSPESLLHHFSSSHWSYIQFSLPILSLALPFFSHPHSSSPSSCFLRFLGIFAGFFLYPSSSYSLLWTWQSRVWYSRMIDIPQLSFGRGYDIYHTENLRRMVFLYLCNMDADSLREFVEVDCIGVGWPAIRFEEVESTSSAGWRS